MKPDFMSRTAQIIAEVRNRTCIDEDADVLKEILQDELKEYFHALNEYYSEGYDEGHSDGHSAA